MAPRLPLPLHFTPVALCMLVGCLAERRLFHLWGACKSFTEANDKNLIPRTLDLRERDKIY